MTEGFAAIVAEDIDGAVKGRLKTLTQAELPDEDVLVEVSHSSLNYKDGLAVSGRGKICRRLPMVCGIDLAGTVVSSRSAAWKPGDVVVVTGHGLSETQWGGFTRFQRLKPEWILPLPAGFDPAEAMAVGTAGVTAMLSVLALERAGVKPGGREIVVTGAAGGVGSVAVSLLAKLGHTVVASTGRAETGDYLKGLGATLVIDRATLSTAGAPMQKERWAGAIDTVGGQTLATLLAQTAYGGAVAACGLAGGTDLPASVFPFILRGVSLIGIESVYAPRSLREAAWSRLASDLDRRHLHAAMRIEPMSRVPDLADAIVDGKVQGRIVIDVSR